MIYHSHRDLLSMEPWAAAKKKLAFSVAVPPAPVRVPNQRPLVPSVASVMWVANDDEMILGAVHRSPDICLTGEEKTKDRMIEKLRYVVRVLHIINDGHEV